MAGNTNELMKKYNIRLTKALGQNFLIDDNVVKKIVDVSSVSSRDIVIEVGPGIGNMTKELAKRAGQVLAIEIDRQLLPALAENLKEFSNVTVINKDVMKLDIKEIIRECQNSSVNMIDSVKVVANLPYYITTPIILKFLEEKPGIETLVFMIQKEVADRMTAGPGGKEFGALSLAVQYYSSPEIAFNVSPNCFIPKPNVDSTVIKLDILKKPPVNLINEDLFFKVIKASFGQRRKTLVNGLSNAGCFNKTKEELKAILRNMGLDELQRGETLTLMQFAELSNALVQS
jgi:16S rRNA (adenine1518-N6/adenine1519-N6)-dimethyltransferase